nr:MAG TPA: Baseplate wedge protein [Caudoviricetes sp.]
MLTKKETLDTIKKTLNLYKTNVLDNVYAKTEYVDSKALPVILINDENKTGPALFPLLPEHNLVFIAGDAQIPDSTGAITTIYGLCYSDLQGDGSKLITEYRTGKAAKVNSNGVLESFEYIDTNVKSIVSNIKGGTINKVLAKNSDTDFDYKWVDMPSIETFKKYVDDTKVAYVKSETECVSIDTSTMKDSFVNNSYTYQQDAVSYLEEGIEYHVEVNGVRYRCLCINNIPGKDIVYETIYVQGDGFSLTINNKVGYSNNKYSEDVTKSSVAIELSDTLLQNPPVIKVIKMDIQYMPTYLMPKDLDILNSLGMNRIGKIGTGSVSLGYNNVANNDFSTALGVNTSATAPATLAHGGHCVASANYSHAEGYGAESNGIYSHAEGIMTLTTGQGAHAEGFYTVASGLRSHAEGSYTLASSQYQHVEGKFNVEDKDNKYAHIVGNGTSKTARKNAYTLDWSGNAWFAGKVAQEGTPTDNKDLVNKKYVDDVKASIVVPTKTSELTNDSNFLTEHQSLTGLATETYVNDKVAGIVNSAPETLDTLQELATALGNDANFATTVSTQIGKKVDKADGMSLTHNDLTNELKANYDAAYTYSQAKHSYNDLTDKPTIPSIDGLATEEYVQNAIASAGIGTGSDVATDDEVKTTINTILGGDYIE